MSRQQESFPTHSEGFVCVRCGRAVAPTGNGTSHRNHCPYCLASRHVDIRPGDRRAGCRSSMSPIAVSAAGKGEWSIIHRCDRCGVIKTNRIAGDDDEAALIALVVLALDGGRAFTEGLLIRLLTTVRTGCIRPVVVLNKSDCAEEHTVQRVTGSAHRNAPEMPVHVVSARTGAGLPDLRREWRAGQTACLLGASGVGKSSLLNALAGRPLERERAVRADHRGRHTTTHKKIYTLPEGGSLMDLPGIRELQPWVDEEDLDDSFPEINEQALDCRFRDCTHTGEPGCAVQDALSAGLITPERYDRYLELQRETARPRRTSGPARDRRPVADRGRSPYR